LRSETEYLEESRCLRALAFWLGDRFVPDYEHHIDGTPCEAVVEGRAPTFERIDRLTAPHGPRGR
jgi:hypothetical protein